MTTAPLPNNIADRLEDYRQRRLKQVEDQIDELRELLQQCESPVEQLLFLGFAEVFSAQPAGPPGDRYISGSLAYPDVDVFGVVVRQQYPIVTRDRQYRTDFLVTLEDWKWENGEYGQLVRVVV